MKKKLTNFLSIALAFSMTTATVTPAFAGSANAPADANIVVKNLEPGDEVAFFKVFDWDDTKGWVLTTPFVNQLTQAEIDEILGQPAYTDPNTGQQVPAVPGKISYDVVNKIAGIVAAGMDAVPATIAPFIDGGITNPVIADSNGEATLRTDQKADDGGHPEPKGSRFKGLREDRYLGAGLYIGLIIPSDPTYVYNPVFVGADYIKGGTSTPLDASQAKYDAVAIAKKDHQSVVKTAKDRANQPAQAFSREVGKTIPYTVDSTLPCFSAEYQHPMFVMTDVLTKGLKLETNPAPEVNFVDASGRPINWGSQDAPALDAEYTIATQDTLDGRSQVKVTIAESFLKKNQVPGVHVQLTYTAKVTDAAVANVNPLSNDVVVMYSNDPFDGIGAIKDNTNHYNYSLGVNALGGTLDDEIVKVAKDKMGRPAESKNKIANNTAGNLYGPLAGVEFTIYTDQACTTKYTNALTNGTYTTTGSNRAVVVFQGLEGKNLKTGTGEGEPDQNGGVYYIKETKCPAGYVMDTTVYKVEIQEQFKSQDVTEWVNPNDPQDVRAQDPFEPFPPVHIKVQYNTSVLDTYNVAITPIRNGQAGKTITTYGTKANPSATITTDNGYKVTGVSINTSSVEVVNTPGTELPSTGGIGITLFYIIGGALVVVAGVMLATKRRMAKEEA